MSQIEKIKRFMASGRPLTPEQARRRLGVQNLRARINDLREQGVCVYTNRRAGKTQYRIGKPSRRIIALAYRHGGSTLFSDTH
jgi:hypothetical protein